MAVAIRKPNLIVRAARRLGEAYGMIPAEQRAAWIEEGNWEHHDLLSGTSTAAARRAFTTNADISAMYGTVYAAIRLRTRMVTRPRWYLVRKTRGADPVEVPEHPALDAIHRMNEALTERQGRALIEQHLLTAGKAYLIKRRNGLGVPVEFEFWLPDQVEVKPTPKKSWVPMAFVRHLPNGSTETVAPRDVLWLRHLIDPRNPLNGLSPIGAVRVEIETGMEARRYNQRFFDNDTAPAHMFTVEEGGPAEVARIEQELERKFKGTDNAHRTMVVEGGLKTVEGSAAMSHKDMEFLGQMRWSKEEIASVFEMSPISLGAMEGSTFSNVEWIEKKDWNTIVDQTADQLAQFNEFFIEPDFGPEFELRADFSMIPALQDDLHKRAEIDEIELRSAKRFINELRERDGEDPVPWGDVPIVLTTMGPLDMRSGAEKDAAKPKPIAPVAPSTEPPRARSVDGAPDLPETVEGSQTAMVNGWERRLRKQLRGFIAHMETADARSQRAIRKEDVDGFDWNWLDDFGGEVRAELALLYERALTTAEFLATPLMPTHELAVRYAQARAAELLSDRGRLSIPAGTRERVRELVTKAIEQGDSIRQLKNALRQDNIFSAGRAETIARTETSTAMGRASVQAYTSNGWEGKEWRTSGFDVDNGDAFGPCVTNEAAGAVRVGDSFPSGDDAPPAHPRCRCTLVPVFEMQRIAKPKRIRKRGTLDGREIDIIEEEMA